MIFLVTLAENIYFLKVQISDFEFHSEVSHTIKHLSPGQVARPVRASSPYAKIAGLIPGQGTYENQPVSA